jgi:hypothetical protein
MKTLALLMLISLCCFSINALDVYLFNGDKVDADNVKVVDGKVVVINGNSETEYTPEQINSVKDGETDLTQDTIGQKSYGAGLDDQFIPENTYFTSKNAMGSYQEINVVPAKLVQPASQDSKKAEFIDLTHGHTFESTYYYKTSIADPQKLQVGQEIIFLQKADEDGINRGPQDVHDVLYGKWTMSTISDDSDIDQGYVTLSNGLKVSTGDVRIVDKK